MFQAQRAALPEFSEVPCADDEDTQDRTQTVQHLLRLHGPSLLQAYNDPEVDFMQVVAQHLRRVSRGVHSQD